MNIYILCFLTFLLSLILTGVVRRHALYKAILDIPNDRSAHQIPIPRGGGLAVVILFILSILYLGLIHSIDSNLAIALSGGGIFTALIGLCDDVYSIHAKWRLLIHLAASVWAVYWLGGFPTLDLGFTHISLQWFGSILAVTGIIWCINLYNFMDGIDGLAGTEAIFISVAVSIPLYIMGTFQLALLLWILCGAIAGFLLWNWPPAKIFMGDVGSGFLGYIFAVISLYTMNNLQLSFVFWSITMGIFLCDATFTVLYRIYQKKRWYDAHSEHAYQQMIALGFSHRVITMSILFLNFFILLPLALTSFYFPAQSIWIALNTMIGLWILWYWIKSLRMD